METRYDCYGYAVTLTIAGDREVYTRQDGVIIKFPIGTGWDRALESFSGLQPGGWVPPEA
jgi:hypothetical protein